MSTSLASAHGGDTSEVHSCVVPDSGAMRIVDAGESCRKNETSLDWSMSQASYTAGEGLVLEGNEFSLDDVSWSDLSSVPAGFADNIDNDGAAELRSDLADGDTAVSFSGITDLVGSIFGLHIQDGSIGAADLAGTYGGFSGTDEVVIGAVTSEKIADATIQSRDIASGAITSQQQTSNAASSSPVGNTTLLDGVASPVVSAILTTPSSGTSHNVLLTGQAVLDLDCDNCSASSGSHATVSYFIREGTTQISPVWSMTLDPNADVVLPVSFLERASGGMHTYDLVVTATRGDEFDTLTATVTSPTLAAIDLGRSL